MQVSLMSLCPDVIGHILSFDKGSYITPCVCKEFNDHTKKYKVSVKRISNFYYRYVLHKQESYTKKTMIRFIIAFYFESSEIKIKYILLKKFPELFNNLTDTENDLKNNTRKLKYILTKISTPNLKIAILEKLKRF
jgi:hypothetical protein